jgi:hypothetical protein
MKDEQNGQDYKVQNDKGRFLALERRESRSQQRGAWQPFLKHFCSLVGLNASRNKEISKQL